MRSDTPEKHDLVFTRTFNAPVALVWRAWTEPDIIRQWWGPDMFTCPTAEIDFQEGGVSVVCMRSPGEFGGQDFYNTWAYTKIIPVERIEFISNLADKNGNTIDAATVGMPADFPKDQPNVVIFRDMGNCITELVITQYGWLAGKLMKMAQMGMGQSLNKMEGALANSSITV